MAGESELDKLSPPSLQQEIILRSGFAKCTLPINLHFLALRLRWSDNAAVLAKDDGPHPSRRAILQCSVHGSRRRPSVHYETSPVKQRSRGYLELSKVNGRGWRHGLTVQLVKCVKTVIHILCSTMSHSQAMRSERLLNITRQRKRSTSMHS